MVFATSLFSPSCSFGFSTSFLSSACFSISFDLQHFTIGFQLLLFAWVGCFCMCWLWPSLRVCVSNREANHRTVNSHLFLLLVIGETQTKSTKRKIYQQHQLLTCTFLFVFRWNGFLSIFIQTIFTVHFALQKNGKTILGRKNVMHPVNIVIFFRMSYRFIFDLKWRATTNTTKCVNKITCSRRMKSVVRDTHVILCINLESLIHKGTAYAENKTKIVNSITVKRTDSRFYVTYCLFFKRIFIIMIKFRRMWEFSSFIKYTSAFFTRIALLCVGCRKLCRKHK